jgi:hypothetical protein
MKEEKQRTVMEQFQKALEAGKEAKTSGAIHVVVNISQGGIQDAKLTIERRLV